MVLSVEEAPKDKYDLCMYKLQTGWCRNRAKVLVNGSPRCAAHNPQQDCKAWDDAAEAAGIQIGSFGWGSDGEERLGFPRPMGPNRIPSARCESGKRPYCTCDTCY